MGQFYLGAAYYGEEGVPQNYTEAAKWYRKAADQGYEPACEKLNTLQEGLASGVAGDNNPLRIKKWKYDQKTQTAQFEFEITSEKANVFALRPWALRQIRQICNEEYADSNPGATKGMLGFSLVTNLDMPKFLVDVTVYRIRLMSHSYDDATRIGTLKVNIGQRGDANYAGAYKWALDNIGVICSNKEIAMEAGQPPPEGAQYSIISEKTTDEGILEITFKTLQ